MKKVLLITEYLNPPYDEGIKKTVYNLFLELDKKYELQVLCRFGFDKENIQIVNTNPLFISNEVRSCIRNFNPDSLIYLPFQSSTFASYMRLKIMSIFTNSNNIILIALQPKPLKNWQQFLIRVIKPKFALTPSPILNEFWNKMKIKNELVPLLTDLTIFKSIRNLKFKNDLRKKYGLPIDAFIISHMGHLNEGRNLKTLIPLQQNGAQIVIAASSSTPEDAKGQESLKNELLKTGMIILDGFIENIEEVYQLSDTYIFPVIKRNSSIGMPLSVLEARACAIPVITTNYGSLKSFLQDDFGGIIYAKPDNFLASMSKFKTLKHNKYTKTKVSELNDMFYDSVHKRIEN